MSAVRLKHTGRYRVRPPAPPTEISSTHIKSVLRTLDRETNVALPIRPQGAGTAATDCNKSHGGTILHLSGLDRIVHVDNYNHTVTAQAGVRLYALSEALAEYGLELIGCHEMVGRTLGGAIAAPCMGASIGDLSGSFASQVISLKLVTGSGKPMTVHAEQRNLMCTMRSSYGLLGVIVEATLKVRPILTFSASHRRLETMSFAPLWTLCPTPTLVLDFA